MNSFKNLLLDIFFPPVCLGCNSFGYQICNQCFNNLEKRGSYICPICNKKSAHGERHNKCKGPIDGLFSILKYDDLAKSIIKQIKYQAYCQAIPSLVNWYISQDNIQLNLTFAKFLTTKPIIIPAPIHIKRLNYRGFNQSELYARQISKKLNLSFSNKIIKKVINTVPQVSLSKKRRLQNLNNAFSITQQAWENKISLKNKNILIIDDVWTTGTTIKSIAKELKKLPINKVWGLTLAR